MTQAINPKIENIENTENIDEMRQHVVQLCQPLLDTMDCVLVTLGKHGLMVVRRGDNSKSFPLAPWNRDLSKSEAVSASYYPAAEIDEIISVSGAGDCLAAGFITGLLKGWSQEKCAALGLKAAECSLKHSPAVPNALSHLIH